MNWTTVEDAIHAWVVAGSGLSAVRVLWGARRPPQPGPAWISMRVTALNPVGVDGVRTADNPTPSAGAELVYTATGVREMTLTLQCFAAEGGGAAGPVALLEAVRAAAALPTRRAALVAGGLGILGFGPVTALDGFVGGHGIFEPRAVMTVRCHVPSEATETGTYIEFVEVERLAPEPSVVTWIPEEPPP